MFVRYLLMLKKNYAKIFKYHFMTYNNPHKDNKSVFDKDQI